MNLLIAADMNGHIGSSNVGYYGMHGGYGYGNEDGSRIFDFTDRLNSYLIARQSARTSDHCPMP